MEATVGLRITLVRSLNRDIVICECQCPAPVSFEVIEQS